MSVNELARAGRHARGGSTFKYPQAKPGVTTVGERTVNVRCQSIFRYFLFRTRLPGRIWLGAVVYSNFFSLPPPGQVLPQDTFSGSLKERFSCRNIHIIIMHPAVASQQTKNASIALRLIWCGTCRSCRCGPCSCE